MNKYDILFTGYLHGFGGAEKSMVKAANGLAERGFKVAVLTIDVNNEKFGLDERVKLYYMPIESKSGIKRNLEHIKKIKHFLKDEVCPAMVMHFWFLPAIFFQFFAKQYKFKNYYSERGDPGDKEYGGLMGVVRSLVFPFMDGFVFQTKGAQSYFSKKIKDKSVVIPNPVYIKESDYAIPEKRQRIVTSVGRLNPQKNFPILIEGFAKIADKHKDVNVHIFGDGELRELLQSQIDSLGMRDRIILKGATSKVFDSIVNSSVFVLPSLYEGMPNALMEAMALGIPSLSADCPPGGPAELIQEDLNGKLFPNNDAISLAEKLDYMLEHPDIAEAMGVKAKNICNTHSTDSVFGKWAEYVRAELAK